MNQILLGFALTLVFVAASILLVRAVRSDGYGKRPPPPSRLEQIRPSSGYRSMV